MSVICARLGNKGKVGVQRGRKTAGCPSFLPPRRAPQSPALRRAQLPAEVQRKTLRPLGANRLRQFVCPAQPALKKLPPVRGELADAVRVPRSAGAEKEPPVRGEPPARFKCPRGSVQKPKSSTLFRVLLRITNAYAFLINASRRSRPLSISVSEVA